MSKETRINIRIDPALREKFAAWCKAQGTTPSDELRRYIVKMTIDFKGGK